MRTLRFTVSGLFAALLLACVTTEETDATIDRRAAGNTAPWKASSVRLQVDTWGPWSGFSGYDKTRAEMSPEQLATLSSWIATPPQQGMWTDKTEAKIQITDADGTVAVYRASQSDEFGPSRIANAPVIPWNLVNFSCLASGGPTSRPSTSPPWANAAELTEDTGCVHGVALPNPCPGDVWLRLPVREPGEYALSTSECAGAMRLRIHSPDGASEVASSDATVAPACPTLTHRFAEAGSYLIAFERTTCEPSQRRYFKLRVSRR